MLPDSCDGDLGMMILGKAHGVMLPAVLCVTSGLSNHCSFEKELVALKSWVNISWMLPV